MSSRDNLTPALTVDKNGKTTTVYRKQESGNSGASPIPAPSMPSARNPRHQTIDSVWEAIFEGIQQFKLPSYKDKMTNVYRNLSGTEDESYPEMVLEMVNKVIPASKTPAAVRSVLITIADGDEDAAWTLHAHSDFLVDNPKHIGHFTSMRKMLIERLDISADSHRSMPTIDAHLYAKDLFDELTRNHDVLGGGEMYYRNVPDVMKIVEKHPEHVSTLMNFLIRGQESISMEDFEDYLSQGAVREGAL